MKSKQNYKVIGMMSGTSLDGLDIAYCRFSFRKKWKFEIVEATTVPYPDGWREDLGNAHLLSGNDLMALDAAYGSWAGEQCLTFIKGKKIKNIEAIASHGHTIFHQTARRLTFQLGDGNAVHAVTGIPVVFDFRRLDVALGGEGAPLVPAGDRLLFADFDVCLNLGGIANISMEQNGKRRAFDICFANMGLNYLSGKAGMTMDKEGALAKTGNVNKSLLDALTNAYHPFRKGKPSLGREGFEMRIKKLLDDESVSLADRLCTFCHSIAAEIKAHLPKGKINIMATGGGALNPFLMSVIRERVKKGNIEIPARSIVEFKEAMVFAFLAVLRIRGEMNVLKSVTRAKQDTCSGVIAGQVKA